MKERLKQFDLMAYEEKLLYIILIMVIVSASMFLLVYLIFAPFLPAILIHIAYILGHIFMITRVEKRKYHRLRIAIISSYLIQLTLATFLWFPQSTYYGLFYAIVPIAAFSTMNLLIPFEKRFAISVSLGAMVLYFASLWLPLNFYLYELTPLAVKILSAMTILSTIIPGSVIFFIFAVGLAQKKNELEYLANTDSLTKAPNRRKFYEYGDQFYNRAKRKHSSFTLLVLDIDHFKRVNDTYGHYIGDEVLIEFSNRIMNAIRKDDIFARQGGEEFAVLLSGTNFDSAQKVAEKIRKIIEKAPFEIDHNVITITVSIGAVQYESSYDSFVDMLNIADHALYVAKAKGRNRSVFMTKESHAALHKDNVIPL